MKCIIIEDGEMARSALKFTCEKVDQLEIVGDFGTAEEALAFLEHNPVDLIFLDIELPEMSGLEFLENLSHSPQIIFTTGNKKYAFEAFEYEVTDFLTKPITTSRFLQSLKKVQARQAQLKAMLQSSAAKEIYIKSEGKYVRLPYESILFFENTGDYIKVITELGNHLIHGSLKALDDKILNPRFLKVHRSFIVNLDKIQDIEDHSIVIGKHVIPVSRSHKTRLLSSINLI